MSGCKFQYPLMGSGVLELARQAAEKHFSDAKQKNHRVSLPQMQGCGCQTLSLFPLLPIQGERSKVSQRKGCKQLRGISVICLLAKGCVLEVCVTVRSFVPRSRRNLGRGRWKDVVYPPPPASCSPSAITHPVHKSSLINREASPGQKL